MMAKTTTNERSEVCSCEPADNVHEGLRDRMDEKSYGRTAETKPKFGAWSTIVAGAVVPLGLAGAAVATTCLSSHERVAITAWICVAIVGTASVISAAAASRRKSISTDRSNIAADEMKQNEDALNGQPES